MMEAGQKQHVSHILLLDRPAFAQRHSELSRWKIRLYGVPHKEIKRRHNISNFIIIHKVA